MERRDEVSETIQPATIGPSITFKGEISGDEDLLIQGAVEGTIELRQNTITVGSGARVSANILGRIIRVEGEVVGDLYGAEQVIVHRTGYVRGNITTPRLSLEDGARLKGTIDTEPNVEEMGSSLSRSATLRPTVQAEDSARRRPGTLVSEVIRPNGLATTSNGVTPNV